MRFHPFERDGHWTFTWWFAVYWSLNKRKIGLTLSVNHCRIMHPYHYCITVLIHEHRVCRDLLLFLGDRLPPTGHGKSCEFTHPIQRDGHVLVTYGQHVCLFSINLCLIVREKCILHFHFMVNFYSSIYSFIYSFIYFFFIF